jgi:hypothetical protein
MFKSKSGDYQVFYSNGNCTVFFGPFFGDDGHLMVLCFEDFVPKSI